MTSKPVKKYVAELGDLTVFLQEPVK